MCPGYDTKQSGQALGMQRTPLLPMLPGPLWLGMVALDRFQIEQNWIVWNRTVLGI